MRLWAVSDIHTDIPENVAWVEGLSERDYKRDALIVAGDVSEDLETLEITLRSLVEKFAVVFFTPGNHDLWLTDEDHADGLVDSLSKLHRILELCRKLGVVTEPRRLGGHAGAHAVWVSPLLSWHHRSFDTEPDIQGWKVPRAEDTMVDYKRCRFPKGISMHDDSAAQAVDQLNDSIGGLSLLEDRNASEPLVTFSHFLPRIELLLEKRFLMLPCLAKAAGSTFLSSRVEALRPAVHIFGHTHFGWDAVHDGVRFVQAALAYPEERMARWHSLSNGEFGREGPLLVWSSASGFEPKRSCRWSGYYEHHAREPERVFELASYAARAFRKLDERAETCNPDFSYLGPNEPSAGNRRLAVDPVKR